MVVGHSTLPLQRQLSHSSKRSRCTRLANRLNTSYQPLTAERKLGSAITRRDFVHEYG
jgi:hypothetical protein